MSTTDVTVYDQENPERMEAAGALFAGATPEDVIEAATEVANRFSDIVRRKEMFQKIGNKEHILIEGWQTVGALVGVVARSDGGQGVRQIPWPEIDVEAPLSPEKEQVREQLLEARALGGAWGFLASFAAVKEGKVIGWGEGRVTRGEAKWAPAEDYALSGMAQTRGQSRTLAAPLRFIVKLAGYESTTPAEDMPGYEPAPASPWGNLSALPKQVKAVEALARLLPDAEPPIDKLVGLLEGEQNFSTEGLPLASVRTLEAIAFALPGPQATEANEPAPGPREASPGQERMEPPDHTGESVEGSDTPV